jgi:cytoskeleton protein RodZ
MAPPGEHGCHLVFVRSSGETLNPDFGGEPTAFEFGKRAASGLALKGYCLRPFSVKPLWISMSETTRKMDPQDDTLWNDNENPDAPGLGELLRSERERKGFTCENISRITRLREHTLLALENEQWNKLPPPVFVKGFIKSYARVLGLDERSLLKLYERAVPSRSQPPRPLKSPQQSRKGRFLLWLIGLGCLFIFLYFGKGFLYQPKDFVPVEKESSLETKTEELPADPLEFLREEPAQEENAVQTAPEVTEPQEARVPDSPPSNVQQKAFPPAGSHASELTPEPEEQEDWLVLKSFVKARTWVKIYVDDQEPREFIFQPGSTPQWKARKGFYVIVGNASGIEFDFNGDKLKDLGKLGEVVGVRFPEDFEIRTAEEYSEKRF